MYFNTDKIKRCVNGKSDNGVFFRFYKKNEYKERPLTRTHKQNGKKGGAFCDHPLPLGESGVWGKAPKIGQGTSSLWGLGQSPKMYFNRD